MAKKSDARRSSLPYDEYVPKKGDLLDNLEEGITYECVSTNSFVETKGGTKIRYGLFVGWHPDYDDEPASMTWIEGDPAGFLGDPRTLREGGGIQQVRRVRPSDGVERTYKYDHDSRAYVFIPE